MVAAHSSISPDTHGRVVRGYMCYTIFVVSQREVEFLRMAGLRPVYRTFPITIPHHVASDRFDLHKLGSVIIALNGRHFIARHTLYRTQRGSSNLRQAHKSPP